VRPWQARRIYWNRSSWSIKPDDDLSDFSKLDVNAYLPLLGTSCGELAADSRSMHKSQGFGVARSRSPIVEYFKLLDETADAVGNEKSAESILAGLDFSWARVPGSAALKRLLQRLIDRAVRSFDPQAPHKSIALLVQIAHALDGVADQSWRAKKQAEVRDLVLACAGLHSEATAADFHVVPGGSIEVTASAINRSPAKVEWREVRFLAGAPADATGTVAVGKPLGVAEVKRTVNVPASAPLSTPYWLALPPEPGLFRVPDPALVGLAEAESPLQVEFVFAVEGRSFVVRRPVAFKWTDPVAGERLRPLEITPAISVRPATQVLMFPRAEARTLAVRVSAAASAASGTLRIEPPLGWSVTPSSIPFALAKEGDEVELSFRILPPSQPQAMATGTLRVVADGAGGGLHLSQAVSHIEHAHIPIQTVLDPSDVRLVSFAIDRQGTKIGYIPGPGDDVPAALRQIGYEVTLLGDEVLASLVPGSPTLARFDAIVVGVRAYNTSDKLRRAHASLMAYVQAGGTLVAQYNTNNRLAPLNTPIGPFPFEIGRERVTDETAAVSFQSADQRLLAVPNRITQQDFDGWVQERGLYFATTWDARYQTVLSMSDPGENPQTGGILWARYGKGAFVYTGLAFFRQLPAGVPGAFRLFANLLAAGQAEPQVQRAR
jgi:hypothetical protein